MFKMGRARVGYSSHAMMITGLLSTDGKELRAKDQVGQKLLSIQVGFKIPEWEGDLVRKRLRISQKVSGCVHLTATGLLKKQQ